MRSSVPHEIPPEVGVMKVTAEFHSPPNWGVPCRLEVEGIYPHGRAFGYRFDVMSDAELEALFDVVRRQARAAF